MFKKQLLFSAVILLVQFAEAKMYFWPVIIKARLERSEEQTLESHSNSWPSAGIAFRMDNWLLSVEKSKYENDSSNGNVSIETTYDDTTLWGGYSLFQGDIWDLYGTAGVGAYQQKVKTSIGGIEQSNKSNDHTLVGAGAEFLIDARNYWAVSVGARFNWTEDLDPQLMPEFYLKAGLGF